MRSLIPDLLEQFDQNVFFIKLHPSQQPDEAQSEKYQLIGAIGRALKIEELDPETQLKKIISTHVQQTFCLILDNFESVMGGAAVIGTLVDKIAGLTVLVTSRVRLNLRREAVLKLDGLPLMQESDSFDEAGPAQRLFERAAQRQSPMFKLTDENKPTVAELCRQLDGLPLAIELVTQQLHLYSIRELITLSQDSGRFLQTDMIDVREEHRSIHQLLQTMWQTLSETAQAVLPELTRFANEWSLEAMETIVPAELAIYNELLNTSMLQQVGPGKFKLHPLIKQFAAKHESKDKDPLILFNLAKSDEENYQLAKSYEKGLTHINEQDAELRFHLLSGVIRSNLVLRENLPNMSKLGDTLFTIAQELNDPQKLIQATVFQARISGFNGQHLKAIELLKQAQSLTQDREDFLKERAIVLFQLTKELSWVHKFSEAIEHLNVWRKLMPDINEPFLEPKFDLMDCTLKYDVGEFNAALKLSLQFAQKCRQRQDYIHLCFALNIAEVTYGTINEFEKQMEISLEIIEVAQFLNNRMFENLSKLNLGKAQTSLGLFEEAFTNLTSARQGFQQNIENLNLAFTTTYLANLYFETDQIELAEKMYVEAIALLDSTDNEWEKAYLLQYYGSFLLENNRFQEAEQIFINSEKLLTEEMRLTDRIHNQCARSWIWCLTGRKAEAQERLEELYEGVNNFDSDDGWPISTGAVLQCIYILESLGDGRAGDLLQRAYKLIHKEAEQFSSPDIKEAFLMNPRQNQKIFELFEQKFVV